MSTSVKYQKYTGESLKEFHSGAQLDAYIPSSDLIQSVDIARRLGRPLLLRGEPGSGKTRLAEAIAFELHGEIYQDFYFPWPIKSTTKAQDGLYSFDHLGRMNDVYRVRELGQKEQNSSVGLMHYVRFGPIARAYRCMNENPNAAPPVILIDEIDKADIDFPNDLLWELDRSEFFISEVKDENGKEARIGLDDRSKAPIIIITSNDEKELPNAFLRRCAFHYIDFPRQDHLGSIVKEYLKGREAEVPTKLEKRLQDVLRNFLSVRTILDQNPNAVKKPSTSELLDWARILAIYLGEDGWSVDDKMNLLENGKIRIRPEQVLLKNNDDERLVGKK